MYCLYYKERDLKQLSIAFQESIAFGKILNDVLVDSIYMDPYFQLERAWIQICIHVKDLEAANNIYKTTLVNKTKATSSDFIIEYIDFTRLHMSVAQARALYKQVVLKKVDYPERIASSWATFESIYGNHESLYDGNNYFNRKQWIAPG